MKKYSSYPRRGSLVTLFCLIVLGLLISHLSLSQTPWSGVNGNEWLKGQYDQQWIRIGVKQKGVQRVKLPLEFQDKATKLRLYHRGTEVSLISASASEIEFYGIPNDGASDALLYRPYTGDRANPYYSWFSDESSYFLTWSTVSTTKLADKQDVINDDYVNEPYHLNEVITTYTDDYTYDEQTNPISFTLDQSYFQESKAITGRAVLKYLQQNGSSRGNPIIDFQFKLNNLVRNVGVKPSFEVLFNSRTSASHSVKVSIGQSVNTLRDYPENLNFTSFKPYKESFLLNDSLEGASGSDIDKDGNVLLRCESLTPTSNVTTVGVFSVAYIKQVYPQLISMGDVDAAYFNFPASAHHASRVEINKVATGTRILNITNPESPIIIPGTYNEDKLEIVAGRSHGEELNLLAYSVPILNNSLSDVTFRYIKPTDYNYLIVASEKLLSEAKLYGEYRKSLEGGAYQPLVVSIKEVYNQFNYGEPSPVAIRRFVDYMLNGTPMDKHNLLLIGPSTTIPRILKLNREIPDEVPTIGFPGSDILLVEGLAGVPTDVPAIPIGRLSATDPMQVLNYLNKVKEFEAKPKTLENKKTFLHLSGGKSGTEINQLRSQLENLVPVVSNNYLGGQVKQVVKQSFIEVEPVDISQDVNMGVGMISYLGHGSPTTTDLDYGYASDVNRGFTNKGKYPLQYFNGCGVGNIFSGRHNPSPTATDRIPLSSDWITSKDKGSIGVIANTYYSFASISEKYLVEFYKQYFTDAASAKLSVGQIQKLVARSIIENNASSYDIANIHQSLLQGDPSIKIFDVTSADYTIDPGRDITITGENDGKVIGESDIVFVNFNVRNIGLNSDEGKIPVRVILSMASGHEEIRDTIVSNIANESKFKMGFYRHGNVVRVIVKIDINKTLFEENLDNNQAILDVDWEFAEKESIYPSGSVVDLIPPYVTVWNGNYQLVSESNVQQGEPIQIKIHDNRAMTLDMDMVQVYLRGCQDSSCDFAKIDNLDGKLVDYKIVEGVLYFKLNTAELLEGDYELRIIAEDMAGNTNSAPFNLFFSIRKDVNNDVVVWPNPATEYVCFDLSPFKDKFNSAKIEIFSETGHLLVTKSLLDLENWYWFPKRTFSGICVYKMVISTNGQDYIKRGRIVILN